MFTDILSKPWMFSEMLNILWAQRCPSLSGSSLWTLGLFILWRLCALWGSAAPHSGPWVYSSCDASAPSEGQSASPHSGPWVCSCCDASDPSESQQLLNLDPGSVHPMTLLHPLRVSSSSIWILALFILWHFCALWGSASPHSGPWVCSCCDASEPSEGHFRICFVGSNLFKVVQWFLHLANLIFY